ncbi:MAG: T9SS type A sorting domain-containing protein, partial [Bacteroidota bacterium]
KSLNAGTTWQFFPPDLNILGYDEGFDPGGQGTYDLAIAIDPNDANKLYTGGINVWGSFDGGQTFNPASHWTLSYGPTLHCDIHFIEFQPLTGNVFVCSDGGLYRTQAIATHTWNDANNGVPWPTLWTELNSGMQITSFYRVSSSKNLNSKLLAGAQDNASFMYDGNSWSTTFGGDGMDNIFDPQDDNIHFTSSQFGNFGKSYDNGQSYVGVNCNVNNEVAEWTTPIINDYNQSGTMYVGYANVIKSTDYGDTWAAISNFPFNGIAYNEISALAVAPTNSNVIYATKRVRYEYNINGSVFKTADAGNTWSDVTAGLPDSLYFTSVEINAVNANIAYVTVAGFSAGNKVFKTINGGASWQNISYNLPNLPVNCIKSLPNGNSLIAACDVGVYQLDETQNTWINISVDIPNVIVSDIEINEAANKIYLSTFGRGIWQADLSVVSGMNRALTTANNFSILPNLNDGNFIISNKMADAICDIQIFDITGRVISQLQSTGIQTQVHLNAAPGKYFVKLQPAVGNAEVGSFVIQR